MWILPVNRNNYEEWFVLYTDNELSDEQKLAVEKFAAANPSVQKELELFQKTKLQPEEDIVFLNKESLYRREEKVRVVSIKWWRMAAAAVLLIGFSAVGYIMFNQKPTNNSGPVAGTGPSQTNTTSATASNTETAKISSAEQNAEEASSNNVTAETKVNQQSTTKYMNDNSRNIAMESSLSKTKETQAISTVIPEKKETNDLPVPVINERNVTDNTEIAVATPKKTDLINSDENKQPAVTLPADPALNFAKASDNNEVVADADQSDKKGSVRGFLRRITRTIEKTTNVKTTDDDDRLLVGGLAIKL